MGISHLFLPYSISKLLTTNWGLFGCCLRISSPPRKIVWLLWNLCSTKPLHRTHARVPLCFAEIEAEWGLLRLRPSDTPLRHHLCSTSRPALWRPAAVGNAVDHANLFLWHLREGRRQMRGGKRGGKRSKNRESWFSFISSGGGRN